MNNEKTDNACLVLVSRIRETETKARRVLESSTVEHRHPRTFETRGPVRPELNYVVPRTEALADFIRRVKLLQDERATAYVCRRFVCQLPVTSAEETAALLDRT